MAPPDPRWTLDDAFRHASGGLGLIALDGRWLELNSAVCDLLGRPRERLLGRSVVTACEIEDAVQLMRRLAEVLDGAVARFALDLRVPRMDGSRTWLRLEAGAVSGPDGAPAYLAVRLDDVTEQRHARAGRDVFFDLCADPLAICDPAGRIVRVNPAWQAALGWSTEDMRARPFLDFVHPDDVARTIEEAARTAEGQPTPRFRNRYRVKSGGHRWLEWHSRVGEDGYVYAIARDVTEQQQALIIFEAEMKRRRQRLDEAEQRLGVHVNHTPLAVVEFDERLRVRRWSARAQALFGWSEEEVIGDRPDQWRFIHEDDADTVATAMLTLVTGDAPSQVVRNRNYTLDGRVVHCEWFMSAVFGEDGRFASMLAFAQDASARVRAEAEAAEREALFRATFEEAPVGIAHVGLDGRWLRVNRTLCDFLGHPAGHLLTLGFQDITHPEDLESDLALVAQVLDGRIDRYEMRKRYVHRDGRLLWAKLTVSLRRGADGTPLHFISIVEDLAEAVEAERELLEARDALERRVLERTRELEHANRTLAVEVEQRREAEGALRESELRIRTILENSYDAFVASDEDGRITEWNRSAEAVFGWRRSEAVGRRMSELIVPHRLRAAHDAGMARFLATGQAKIIDQRLQLPALHRSGREFPVELMISVVHLGRRRVLTAFLHDISERVVAEEQLRDSAARLRSLTDAVPAMIAHVGPDLRFRFTNEAYRAWFGRAGTATEGLHMRELLGDAGFRSVEPYLRRVLAGERVSFERESTGDDGVARHEQVTYLPDAGDDAATARGFFVASHDITPQRRLADLMERRALHDELTGLPNRAAWTRALDTGLARSEREALGAAVMFIDLDDFKRVNDTHGHEAGDAVLREFARRLRGCVRGTDTVARLAGDEFVILLEALRDPSRVAAKVGAAIARAMAPPFEVGGLRLPMTCSVGVAAQQDGRFDRGELLRRADEAMYTAKRASGAVSAIVEA